MTWRSIGRLFLVASLGATAVGCDRDEPIMGDRVPNSPPNTEIVSAPPAPERSGIRVSFSWTGFDHDGDVVGYEWRISNNGNDGAVSVEDTLEANLPWNFTTVRDTTFVVSADLDSFAVDVEDPDLGPRDYRQWQTHTLFVRAVDDRGGKDPTPATLSFTSTTLSPTIVIDVPVNRPFNTCVDASRVLTFGWTGHDLDSEGEVPKAVRYIFVPIGEPSQPCILQTQFENGDYLPPDDPRWSDWIPYGAPDMAGRRVTLPRQETGASFLFAVQAIDEAGAISPTLEWGRNVRHVRVGNNKYPLLRVTEGLLGSFEVVGTATVKSFEVVATQPVSFTWSGDASSYAGTISAYRYGIDVADIGDPYDPGWQVPWGIGSGWQRTGTLLFEDGSPNVVVQCRDNSGTVSSVLIQLRVVGLGNREDQRNMLIVDDWPEGPTPAEQMLDRGWDERWVALGRSVVSDFVTADVVDALNEDRLDFDLVNRYKSVLWFTNSNIASFLRGELLGSDDFNWLELYQQRVGNLMFMGPGPGVSISPSRAWIYPLIFDVPQGGLLGLGTTTNEFGRQINVGTLSYPYRAFCLEAVDFIRPALLKIYGESGGVGRRKRMAECDDIARAVPTAAFFEQYPDAQGFVVNLEPREERVARENAYRFDFEEFYDTNATARPVQIRLRDCQTSMFEMVARRDVGWVTDPESFCEPRNLERSTIDGATVAVLSRAYADTKQLRGSEDVIWGFHPLGFETGGVQAALRWLAESRWELDVR